MLPLRIFITPAIAATGLLAVTTGAKAQATYTLTQTENFSFVPNGGERMTFDKFDDLDGTRILQSVEITVEYTKFGGSLAVDNDSATAGTINLQHAINGDLTVFSGGVSLLDLSFDPIGSGLDAVSSYSSLGIEASTGDPTNEFNSTGLGDYFLFAPTDLTVSDSGTINSLFNTGYIATSGSNSFVLSFDANQTTSATGLGGLQQAFVVSSLEGFVTVKYNYDVVPEPSSALLGLAGIVGLLARRRR